MVSFLNYLLDETSFCGNYLFNHFLFYQLLQAFHWIHIRRISIPRQETGIVYIVLQGAPSCKTTNSWLFEIYYLPLGSNHFFCYSLHCSCCIGLLTTNKIGTFTTVTDQIATLVWYNLDYFLTRAPAYKLRFFGDTFKCVIISKTFLKKIKKGNKGLSLYQFLQ